ncbi:MAG: dihydroorotase, partial [Myxococcota bacterium]
FGRALVMPNLSPPVTTVALAEAYRERIRQAQGDATFEAQLTCYLTDDIDPAEVVRGAKEGVWLAAKLYPAHATTGSSHGVTDIEGLDPVLAAMAEVGMPLCVHAEVTDPAVDIFEREQVFLDTKLAPLVERHPTLKVVVEHATTARAVAFVREHADGRIAASITPHHLWWNRNALFAGGLRPHAYCLPVLKTEHDRRALVEAATSGDARFFAGTDSAPHEVATKECDHGCAGIFNAPTALAAYAEVFAAAGALDRLGDFVSVHGARFYGLPVSEQRVTIDAGPFEVPERIAIEGGGSVVPFLAGETLGYRVIAP